MAGLVPAIHVFSGRKKERGCPAPATPRLRRGTPVLARRSFSGGGKAGHDEQIRGGLQVVGISTAIGTKFIPRWLSTAILD
jgi:hypothetical protein